MDVKINQVILHILDAGASEPVLSDRPMELDADLYEYFPSALKRHLPAMTAKLPLSAGFPLLQEMQHNDDFIDLSRRIAGVILNSCCNIRASPPVTWPWWTALWTVCRFMRCLN